MKILFLTRLYYPHVGGVERHIKEISSRLKKKGYKITIITTKHDKKLPFKETKGGIEIIRFNQPKIKYLGLLYTWYWLLKNKDFVVNNDIIHIHDIFSWYLPFRFLFPQKPVYTTFHGRWGQYPIPFKDIIQKKIGAKFSTKNLCIGKYIPKNYKIVENDLSYGAVDVSEIVPNKDSSYIVYVGRLDKDIALDKFLDIIPKLKNIRVEFCGDGKLKGKCSKYGKVHGWVNPEAYLAKAKFCFASGYLTILEALVNKCLVFTIYSHPLQKDYYKLTPFSKYILSTNSSEEILTRITYLNKNKAYTQKLINRGYNWAEKQTWEKLVAKYLSLWGVNKA